MFAFFANPARFLGLARIAAPVMLAVALAALCVGTVWGLIYAPADYQQGDSVRIMYVHVPSAWLAMMVYGLMGGASLFGLVFRHVLADVAAKAAAPLGAAFTALALFTGALWGKPMWGAYWVWDARLTSMLILLMLYIAYILLHQAIEDEGKAAKAAAILCLVGCINLPIIKFSVNWWNTLHQPASVFRKGGPTIDPAMLWPLAIMAVGFMALFFAVWMMRIETAILRQRARVKALQAGGAA
jgi:heme exporter protein C